MKANVTNEIRACASRKGILHLSKFLRQLLGLGTLTIQRRLQNPETFKIEEARLICEALDMEPAIFFK